MIFQSDKTSGNIVLTVENAAIGYDGEILTEPINLDLRKHECSLSLIQMDRGKSTFIAHSDQIPFITEKRFS